MVMPIGRGFTLHFAWLLALIPFQVQAVTWDHVRPLASLTPGLMVPVTVAQICVPRYSATVRNVSASTKWQVFKAYGVDPTKDTYEIDHLISLELGGSNDVKNLWPQSYTTQPYNAHVKDTLENKLHYMVCHGALDLAVAQKAIATDWIAACKLYVPGCPR